MELSGFPHRFTRKLCADDLAAWGLLFFAALGLACPSVGPRDEPSSSASFDAPPNVIVLLADDMGYGDTGESGHPSLRTPTLDRMAREGQRWTNFYAAASVCTPSRAGLLTGRLPIRSGLASSRPRVLFPWSRGGLPASEFTLAELFASRGYATALVGKWHLGHRPEFLPTRHGFDEWFGIPYSNDMDKTADAKAALPYPKTGESPASGWYAPKSEWFQIPLMRGETVIERGPDQRQLTRRFADESIDFLRRHQDDPFFLEVAFTMPHVPLFGSPEFAGKSRAGRYGDVIEELDAQVGRIIQELARLGLDRRTLVLFTSDNGPWKRFGDLGGSAEPLRGGKSTAWEGGFRVPTLFWSPGQIRPGVIHEIGSSLDLMATFAALLGVDLPAARRDGYDLSTVLEDGGAGPRREMFFYLGGDLAAVREGPFKAHYLVADSAGGPPVSLDRPLLYQLNADPSERFDLADSHPEILDRITRLRERHLESVVAVQNQLDRR